MSTANVFDIMALACFASVIGAQIWLVIIIMRGSPIAALLCLIVPFLALLFVRDHWDEAKKPVYAWFIGLGGLIILFSTMRP